VQVHVQRQLHKVLCSSHMQKLVAAVPCVRQNAIIDALAHLGVRHIDMPASPQRVWQALRSASAGDG